MASNTTTTSPPAKTTSAPAASSSGGAHKLGLIGLIAIVFGGVIGGGIFNIAQNMAVSAGLIPALIAWGVTAIGFMFLVLTFQMLAQKRPDLNAGIYQYAQVGYGNFVGFNIAWGYWLCSAMGNVAFAVMLCQAFGAFWPPLLKSGIPMLICGSAFIWLMFFIVARGVKAAAAMNTIVTVVKFASLILIVVILIIGFKVVQFTSDVWGTVPDLGSIGSQVKNTMLVTLWCFIGIEGAVVMSGRAKKSSDVGKAGIIGFLLALVLYVLISAMSYAILSQPQLAKLNDPSVAYVLKAAVGEWAYWAVIISVIISLLGGWIAWTLVCAQTPYTAALVKILPPKFAKENKKGVPMFGLLLSSIIMQVFMLLVVTANSVYMAAIDLTGVMVLPAYLFCGLYLTKATFDKKDMLAHKSAGQLAWMRIVGIVTTIYCCWLIYAGGLLLMLITSIVYVLGVFFYIRSRHKYDPGKKVFRPYEVWILVGLIVAAVVSVILIIMGKAGI